MSGWVIVAFLAEHDEECRMWTQNGWARFGSGPHPKHFALKREAVLFKKKLVSRQAPNPSRWHVVVWKADRLDRERIQRTIVS